MRKGGEKGVEVPQYVRKVLEKLEAAGFEAWCVGGCVRDSLLGLIPQDWDVTTSALPEETMEVFGKQGFPTGVQHGTVTVRMDHQSVEVTTFRVDGIYRDHRRPESVSFSRSLMEDLRRRDFTVNAMALNLRGELQDPFCGQADLKAGLLRCVGEPDCRFEEDALRILRGLRFAATLSFSLEAKTGESIHKNRELLREIAVERIQTELMKLLCGKNAAEILRQYPDVLGVFWPEVLPMVGFDQKNIHHCYDIWEHSIHALERVPAEAVLRCAALLHDVGKPKSFTVDEEGVGHFYGHGTISRDMADQMLRRIKCSTEFRETVTRLVDWHDRDIPRTEKSIGRALRILGETDLRRLIALKRADNLAQAPAYHDRQQELDKGEKILEELLSKNACFSLKQLAVNGNDLIEIGLSGPEIGRQLNKLLDLVTDGELPNDRAVLLAAAQNMAGGIL